MKPSVFLICVCAAVFAAAPCLGGPPAAAPECEKAFQPQTHAIWDISQDSWRELCRQHANPVEALEAARQKFIENCVRDFAPKAQAAGMAPQTLQAECGRGKPGREALERASSQAAPGKMPAAQAPRGESAGDRVSKASGGLAGAVKSGDLAALYGERNLKADASMPAAGAGAAGAGPASKDSNAPFKIEQHLRTAQVPPPMAGAPRSRPEMLRLIQSRVVADGVAPGAAAIARKTVAEMVVNADSRVLKNLIDNRVWVCIIPKDKKLVEVPAFSSLKGQKTFDGRVWDDVRGIAGVPFGGGWAVAVGEENLIPGKGRDIHGYPARFTLVHEFGHAIQNYGLPEEEAKSAPPGALARAGSTAAAFLQGLGDIKHPDWAAAWSGAKLAFQNQGGSVSRPASDELYNEAKKAKSKTGLGWYADSSSEENFAESTAAYFGVGYSSDNGAHTDAGLLSARQPGMAQMLYRVFSAPKDLRQ